jgi:hypothetical protein
MAYPREGVKGCARQFKGHPAQAEIDVVSASSEPDKADAPYKQCQFTILPDAPSFPGFSARRT